MKGSLIGPSFSNEDIKKSLDKLMTKYIQMEKPKLVRFIAEKISKGKVVGWFQNRMEFGPRALGARSIIADPRDKLMQKKLNLKLNLESFRPFAPSVLEEHSDKWFNLDCNSPYMLLVSDLNKNKLISQEKKKIQFTILYKSNQIKGSQHHSSIIVLEFKPLQKVQIHYIMI